MGTMVNISSPNHHQTIMDGIWGLFTRKRGVDIELKCMDGHAIQVHRIILELFVNSLQKADLVESNSRDGKIRTLDLGMELGSDLEFLVEFIYKGNVSLPEDRLESVTKAAGELGVSCFVECARQILKTSDCHKQEYDAEKLVQVSKETPDELSVEEVCNAEVPLSHCVKVEVEDPLDVSPLQYVKTEFLSEGEESSDVPTFQCVKTRAQNIKSKGVVSKEKLKCEDCGIMFANSIEYRTHFSTVHSTDRPFKCTECDYTSTRKSHIKKHVACVHVCRRPFTCETCGLQFKRSYDLKRHERTHTGEKPFACHLCNRKYADSHPLKRHLKMHENGEKPFACKLCDYTCWRKTYLKLHVTRKHKKSLKEITVGHVVVTEN